MTTEIGSLRVGISLDSARFEQSMQSVDRNIKGLSQEMGIIRAKGKDWGDSTEGLGEKQRVLSTLLESQDVKVLKLKDAYEKAAKEQGENSKGAEELAVKLNKAVAEYTRTEKEISDVNAALGKQQTEANKTEQKWEELSKSIVSTGDKMQEQGEKIKGVGEKLSVGVTAPIAALGLAAGKSAFDFDSAQGKIQAQLGLTGKEAEKLGDMAKDVWKNAFGEDITEVGDNLAFVKQTIKGLTDNEMKDFVEGAYTIKDAFDAEINETTRTASVLMKNFSIDGKKALDLITVGFQKGGNFSDELLDTLREYAPQFKGMGYNADEFLAILISGAEKGAFNLDKVGDAAKEAFLRIGDGSSGSRDALEKLGLNFKQIETDINSGGDSAKRSFAAVVSAIASVKDPAEKAQTAVALLGTPIEDLGPEFQDFFATVNYDLGKVEGATKKAGDALYDNFGSRLQGELRKFQAELEPAGDILLDIAEEWLPKLSTAAREALEWFQDLGPEGQETAIKIAAIAAAAGPTAIAIGSITTGVGGLLKVVAPAIPLLGSGTGMAGVLAAISSPVGLATAGVVGLTTAIGLGVSAYKESNEISLESIEAKQAEIEKNDELIAKFDQLKNFNKLTNDEMIRFLDIQYLLKSTGAPEEVARLKDEQALLLEKSGLTNDEMMEFIKLNDQVIEKAPSTTKSVSDLGQAYADNTLALKELNAEQARQLEIEAYEAVKKSIEQMNELIRDQKQTVSEINDIEGKLKDNRQTIIELQGSIKSQEQNILDLEKQKEGSNGSQLLQLQTKIDREKGILIEQKNNLDAAMEIESTFAGQLGLRRDQLDAIAQEIQKSEEARFKYEEIILAQAGITSEKGKGLTKIDEEISKLTHEKALLEDMLSTGKINTAEYNEQNNKLNTQINKLRDAQGELKYVNELAGQTIYKDIKIQSNPSIEEFQRALSAPITRFVNVITNGSPVPAYASGTTNAKGGLSLVGEQGPELMYIPKGARIIPNQDTNQILKKWNVPTIGSPTVTSNIESNMPLPPVVLMLDGNQVAAATYDPIMKRYVQDMTVADNSY